MIRVVHRPGDRYFIPAQRIRREAPLRRSPERVTGAGQDISTTVVDSALAAVNRTFDSGSTWLGIDVVFATRTNAADVQVRAIRATAFR